MQLVATLRARKWQLNYHRMKLAALCLILTLCLTGIYLSHMWLPDILALGRIINDEGHNCSMWTVIDFEMFTVLEELVSSPKIIKSVHRLANHLNNDSCVLAILDPWESDYLLNAKLEEDPSYLPPTNAIWLTQQRYQHWCQSAPTATRDFCEHSLHHHSPQAGRNIGFLYAIFHGANSILEISQHYILADFSDEWWDNVLHDVINDDPQNSTFAIVSLGFHVFNPFPLLFNGRALPFQEPFGFPSEYKHLSCTHGEIAFKKKRELAYANEIRTKLHEANQVRFRGAVTHFLLLPEDSRPNHSSSNALFPDDHSTLVAPNHAFVPNSLQPREGSGIVLWSRYTLWALLLPVSFRSKAISEVVRSYIAQALFRDADAKVMFRLIGRSQHQRGYDSMSYRNESNDSEAELFNMTKLVNFLQTWSSSPDPVKEVELTVDGRMELLWGDLAAEGFVTSQDVLLAQLWRKALLNYPRTDEFCASPILPPLRPRINNVIVMGQFNYGRIPVRNIIYWVQKYLEYFSHVTLRGPFSHEMLEELSSHGILASSGPNDDGFWSPLQNLMHELNEVQFRNLREESTGKHQDLNFLKARRHNKMEGVLYVHDDAILNMTQIFSTAADLHQEDYRHGVFPTDVILSSSDYRDPRLDDAPVFDSVAYKIYPSGSVFSVVEHKANLNSTETFTYTDLRSLLNALAPRWLHYNKCLEGQVMVAKHLNSSRYRESDGSIFFSPFAQSDFLYIPVGLTSEFSLAAQLHLQNPPVFLECSIPTVVDMVRRKTNVSVTNIGLCTNFDYTRTRGTPAMILGCLGEQRGDANIGVYHPYKLSRGLDDWNQMFDALNR